jgi:glycine cleavage system transcriptional repressor
MTPIMKKFIVTVTVPDRVGIVHAVTGAIWRRSGNIVELSQTVMRGYFTLILAVEFEQEIALEDLREAITSSAPQHDLTVAVLADEGTTAPPVPGGERFILTVLGPDRTGNIQGIAGCLAKRGVNIVDLYARAEESGRFSLVMEAYLPPNLPPGEVRAELDDFGKVLGLESYVQHEAIFLATSEPSPVRVASARSPE